MRWRSKYSQYLKASSSHSHYRQRPWHTGAEHLFPWMIPNWRGLPWKHKPYSTRLPCSVKRCPSHVVGLHCPEHLANHNMVMFYIRYILNPTSGFPNFTTDKTILGLAVRGNIIGHPGNLDFCPFPLQTLRLFTKHLRSCWWNCPIFPGFWWWDLSGSLKN